MQTSHKKTSLLFTFTFTAVFSFLCLLSGQGTAQAQAAFPSPGVSDQQAGWMLVYPFYTSRSSNAREDTFITITNASNTVTAAVHVYFLEGASCAQADMFICLTPNASQSFKASEIDPENTGYIIAYVVAQTGPNAGCPDTTATILIGNAFVNIPTDNIQGAYGAEAFGSAGASCVNNGNTATLTFNAPNRFAVEVQSPQTIPNQRVILAGLSGDLNGTVTGAGQVGAGQVINGNETPAGSFSAWIPQGCLSTAILTNNTPRAPGGINRLIPSGQVGTIKFSVTAAVGLLLVPNNSTGRAGIRTLHKLGTRGTTLEVGVFPAVC
ncbi:MAG TPA: hypothetical protein VFZ34_06735 [Blastocatellia bacterium]|nr:hypothetical protein [Blastocatellia bacterium]